MTAVKSRRSPLLPLGLLIVAFLGVMVWAVDNFVTRDHPGANDFFLRWYPARAYFVEGRDPYDPKLAGEIENILYGHPHDLTQDEYPGDFLYPMSTAILIAPLAVLPYEWASAIWIVVIWVFVAAAFLAMVNLFRWRAPFLLVAFGVAWTAFFYPASRGMFLGQPGTVVVCLELLTLWAIVRGHDIPAGIMLAVSTFKPQLGFLILPFLLLWALRFKRWRFLSALTVTGIVLYGASFLMVPSWVTEWLAQTRLYTGYTQIGSPVSIITGDYLPFLDGAGELILSVLLMIAVLWAWYQVLWQRRTDLMIWTAALSLTVTHTIALRTATPHYVVFLIVLVFGFRELYRTDPRWGSALVLAAMIILGVALWVLFLATLQNRFENAINYLPLPFGSLVVLWLTRKRWMQFDFGLTAEAGS
jgi:hypothetical protein